MRSAVVAMAACLALVGAAPAAADGACPPEWIALAGEDGIGGTGYGDEDGIGGTGFGDEDGVGGTGIFGTVAGFGSVCVNGFDLAVADALVTRNGVPFDGGKLALGHLVWIVAQRTASGWSARTLDVVVPVAGRVDAVDPARRRFVVAGETVEWAAQPPDVGSTIAEFEPRVGDRVEVSGLRRPDGVVVATRVDPMSDPSGPPRSLAERVARTPGLDALSLEGFPTHHADGLYVSGIAIDAEALGDRLPQVGERWLVSGAWRGDALRATRSDAIPTLEPGASPQAPTASTSGDDAEPPGAAPGSEPGVAMGASDPTVAGSRGRPGTATGGSVGEHAIDEPTAVRVPTPPPAPPALPPPAIGIDRIDAARPVR